MANAGESTSQAVHDGGSLTVTVLETAEEQPQAPLVLRLRGTTPVEERPRVRWADDTVDNEGMGKAKSKCCCIYKKPKKWDESSSDDDSDCETGRCRGHVEKRNPHDHDGSGPSGGGQMV
uniref:E3 ubiquitin-protein ligase PPP1R11 n=1 Tax=Steinernema glaseri TaxID=37863 RepID=A0A1I8A9J6_9BILA